MIGIDTNVVVRLIVGDDEAQVSCALELAARETFFVSLTVLMETEWVLRSRYAMTRAAIVTAFGAIERLVDLHFEQEDDVRWAIEHYAAAGELADYLHIAAARPAGRFATFEWRLAERAGGSSPAIVETLG